VLTVFDHAHLFAHSPFANHPSRNRRRCFDVASRTIRHISEHNLLGDPAKAEKVLESLKKYQTGAGDSKRELYEIAASTQMEAKTVVERGMKAFNAHDLEAMSRDAAPDIEATAPGDVKLKGPQALKEYNQNFITAFPDARVEAKNIFTQGNIVIVEGIFTGTNDGTLKTPMGDVPATGRKVKGEFVQILEVDRGLVKRNSLLYDQVQLMTQLGLAGAPTAQSQKASATR